MSDPTPDASIVQVIRCSAANAFADLKAVYTWRSWTFGWLGRMLAQVAFFTLLGKALDQPGATQFLVVGNAVMTCVIESMLVVVSTSWERATGTLPLLVAAPAELGWVFVGRSLQWPVSGCATTLVSLFAIGPLFGLRWTVARILVTIPLVILTAFSTYAFGLFLGALVLKVGSVRNIVSNVAYMSMMAFCGAEVPVDYWPPVVRVLAALVPVTHGLAALRTVVRGGGYAAVVEQAVAAAGCGLAWLAVAIVTFRLIAERGRRSGTIEFAS